MGNNETSGIVVATALANWVSKLKIEDIFIELFLFPKLLVQLRIFILINLIQIAKAIKPWEMKHFFTVIWKCYQTGHPCALDKHIKTILRFLERESNRGISSK